MWLTLPQLSLLPVSGGPWSALEKVNSELNRSHPCWLSPIVHTPLSMLGPTTALCCHPFFCLPPQKMSSGLAWFVLFEGGGFSPFAFLCMFLFAPWQERSKLMRTTDFQLLTNSGTGYNFILVSWHQRVFSWVLYTPGTHWLAATRKIWFLVSAVGPVSIARYDLSTHQELTSSLLQHFVSCSLWNSLRWQGN